MKKFTAILSLFLLSTGISWSQANDPLLGTWKNSYGSELDISWHNTDGAFSGLYSSSTGATGKYLVAGFSPAVSSKKDTDTPQPVSLSIFWRPIKGATGSADEQWTSSMTGQIIQDKSGEWIMEVFHSLNASAALPAVEIEKAGRYAETLIFKRSSTRSANASSERTRMMQKMLENAKKTTTSPPIHIKNPLQDNWVGDFSATYPHLEIVMAYERGESVSPSETGLLLGKISQKGIERTILGFTTPTAPTGNVQSCSFNFMGKDEHGAVCYSANGFLYDGEQLELTISKSKTAPYASKYTAVQITEKAVFYRGPSQNSINIAMQKNPFTNNGATEWTANFSVGNATPHAPVLKFGMDTGGSFTWVNSTQCTTKSCTGYRHVQFNPHASPTFQWIDKTPKEINWGPWGKAIANLGSDYIRFSPNYDALRYTAKLITHFDETAQFDEFLWDGAFAFPASSTQMVKPTTNILKNLVDNGQLKPNSSGRVCVAFYFDPEGTYGSVTMGEWDPNLVDESSKLTFKYEPYSEVPYLWCTPLKSFSIGDKKIAATGSYSFDTGSSALKGDSARMQQTLGYAKQVFAKTGKWPAMHFEMGVDSTGQAGQLELTGDQYVQLIEEGEHVGEHVPQIQTLSGTPNLYLQGSTMLNYVYSVFWWDVHPSADGTYDLTAREVWFFNKKDGPKIIQQGRLTVAAPTHGNNGLAYPNPAQKRINVVLSLDEKSDIVVNVYSLQGENLYKKRYYGLPRGKSTITVEGMNWERLGRRASSVILSVEKGRTVILKERIVLTR